MSLINSLLISLGLRQPEKSPVAQARLAKLLENPPFRQER